MARTWPVTRKKKAVLRAFDIAAKPIASILLRDKSEPPRDVRKILVLELWHIGDVVLATAALQELRKIYPKARITLLAKPHAVELLEGSGLVDEVIAYDFPWTATTGKYRLDRYDRREISTLIEKLRAQQFDVSVDCRMDVRSNLLTRRIGASRRIGYDFGGGGFLLTDALPAPPADQHKVDDWRGLLAPLRGKTSQSWAEPSLTVADDERHEAKRVLESYEVTAGDVIVGIHPGGSHHAKRWPEESFAEVGRRLAHDHNVRLLVFVDRDGCGSNMQAGPDAIFVRTSLREMMALLTHCDILICNDSGPMHMAAALGVPVVAVFRTGSPSAYGPRGLDHVVIGSGAPWGETTDISVDEVIAAADGAVARICAQRRRGTGKNS